MDDFRYMRRLHDRKILKKELLKGELLGSTHSPHAKKKGHPKGWPCRLKVEGSGFGSRLHAEADAHAIDGIHGRNGEGQLDQLLLPEHPECGGIGFV